ncbi:MAG: helix-hairpin-helix domain-containing protein [Variovorax sp.]
MTKARKAADVRRLEDIPNIGRSLAADLRSVDVHTPADVKAMKPRTAYELLRGPMGRRHDPCVLDTFLAAHDFMNGGVAQPWFAFTERRKAMLKD